jgi:hypothetical protein
MGKITKIEYFRVLPRWLFVKVEAEGGDYGWGESTLEGHTEAIEGSLDELIGRFVGYEAEYVTMPFGLDWSDESGFFFLFFFFFSSPPLLVTSPSLWSLSSPFPCYSAF